MNNEELKQEVTEVEEVKETTEVKKEEPITIDDIDRMMDAVNSEVIKRDYIDSKDQINKQRDQLVNSLGDITSDKQFIFDRLEEYKDLDSLKAYLSKDDNVRAFFTNPVTGEELELNTANKDHKSIEFRRDLLLYIKLSDIEIAKIDEEYKKLDEATQEFQEEIGESCNRLLDEVLTYSGYLKDKAEAMTDEKMKQRVIKSAEAIESGITLDVYFDTYKKYPSSLKRCKEELENEIKVSEIGARYLKKLDYTLLKNQRATKVSLIPFVSDPEVNRLPFEKLVLSPDEYTTPDLFVYSLIRFYAMADWNDMAVRQAHASIALTLRKLVTNKFDEELSSQIRAKIVEYLKMFE